MPTRYCNCRAYLEAFQSSLEAGADGTSFVGVQKPSRSADKSNSRQVAVIVETVVSMLACFVSRGKVSTAAMNCAQRVNVAARVEGSARQERQKLP